MSGPVIALLVVGAFAVGVSFARVVRIARVRSIDPEALATFTKRHRGRRLTLSAAVHDEDAASPFAALAHGLAEDEPVLRAALCNEALHELEADLAWGAAAPSAGMRLCFFASLLTIAWAILSHRSLATEIVDVVGVGGGALMVVMIAKREADRLAKKTRSDIDAWVTASTPRKSNQGIVASS